MNSSSQPIMDNSTGYHPVPLGPGSAFKEPMHDVNSAHSVEKPKSKSFKNRLLRILSLIFGLCWIGPIAYLLYVNFSEKNLGAAAWCPNASCGVLSYYANSNVTTVSLAGKYDHKNRNLLGAFQFVAKALEVWFVYIGTSFVYHVTCVLAKRKGGLPIGYLLTHLEYADLRCLIDPIMYIAPRGKARSHPIVEERRHRVHLYVFAGLAILMCIIANLMGPSVAVLLIPTLRWRDTPHLADAQFVSMNAATPPTSLPGCDDADLANGFFNCTDNTYGVSLDSLVIATLDELNQDLQLSDGEVFPNSNSATSYEHVLPFIFNVTSSHKNGEVSEESWAPSRQVLRSLSSDFEGLYQIIRGNTSDLSYKERYAPYNSSLSLVLQRAGPMIGMQQFSSWGNLSVTQVDDDRQVRCYDAYTLEDTPRTKCFRTGTGWNASDVLTSFTTDRDQTVGRPRNITAYWADKAIFLDSTSSDTSTSCFVNGTLPADADCDWASIFDSPQQISDLTGAISDMIVLEVALPFYATPQLVLTAEFNPFFGFATYSFDASTIDPTINMAQVANPPSLSETFPLVLHPAWILAAWSTQAQGDVFGYRDSAYYLGSNSFNLVDYIATATRNTSYANDEDFPLSSANSFYSICLYTALQAASMVTFESTPTTSTRSADPRVNPVFWTNLHRQVWGWGLDTRTSKLGIVVCFIGILVTIARTVLVIVTRHRERNATELIQMALEHNHTGELSHARDDLEAAKVRYQLIEQKGHDRLRLSPVR